MPLRRCGSYASATSACLPLATAIPRGSYAESTCRQDYPCRLTPPGVTLAGLSSGNTAVAALCGWLRFSLLRDSLSGACTSTGEFLMTEIYSAPSYPRCSDYFTQGRSVCRWPNSSLDMNLAASKTGSPGAIATTLSARFSPSGSHHIWLSSTIYNPHPTQNT